MPIYTYKCKKCDFKFDLLVGVSKDKEKLECKNCKSPDIEKTFASFSVGATSNSHTACEPTPSCSMCPNAGTCPSLS